MWPSFLTCILAKWMGWATSTRLQRDLVLEALTMALGRRIPACGLIHHSDRGSQYASQEFQARLRDQGIACSMSGRGNCFDNAVAESFFATLKRERVHRTHYRTRAEATTDLFQYLEMFYNRHRRHSTLGQRSPELFEHGGSSAQDKSRPPSDRWEGPDIPEQFALVLMRGFD